MSMLAQKLVRRVIARILIGVLASAQVALAAYACPSETPIAQANAGSAMGDMAMGKHLPNGNLRCDAPISFGIDAVAAEHGSGIDPLHPNLCVAHCQSGQQNADSKPAPTLLIALLAHWYAAALPGQSAADDRLLALALGPPQLVDPPHAILHCCFRI